MRRLQKEGLKMKEIRSREEYAKAVNFGKYPVLMIDMNQKGFMGEIFTGMKDYVPEYC